MPLNINSIIELKGRSRFNDDTRLGLTKDKNLVLIEKQNAGFWRRLFRKGANYHYSLIDESGNKVRRVRPHELLNAAETKSAFFNSLHGYISQGLGKEEVAQYRDYMKQVLEDCYVDNPEKIKRAHPHRVEIESLVKANAYYDMLRDVKERITTLTAQVSHAERGMDNNFRAELARPFSLDKNAKTSPQKEGMFFLEACDLAQKEVGKYRESNINAIESAMRNHYEQALAKYAHDPLCDIGKGYLAEYNKNLRIAFSQHQIPIVPSLKQMETKLQKIEGFLQKRHTAHARGVLPLNHRDSDNFYAFLSTNVDLMVGGQVYKNIVKVREAVHPSQDTWRMQPPPPKPPKIDEDSISLTETGEVIANEPVAGEPVSGEPVIWNKPQLNKHKEERLDDKIDQAARREVKRTKKGKGTNEQGSPLLQGSGRPHEIPRGWATPLPEGEKFVQGNKNMKKADMTPPIPRKTMGEWSDDESDDEMPETTV